MTDLFPQRTQFENVGRNEYTKSDDRNPVDCSLYYLALKKKAVLMGLWRMATWSREQGATQRLLSNNFKEPRWRTAALKNAYALMGRRRFGEYNLEICVLNRADIDPRIRCCIFLVSGQPERCRWGHIKPNGRYATCDCGSPCLRRRRWTCA